MWLVNDEIPLTAIATACGWHRATVITSLQDAGLDRGDAEAFTAFIFAAHAEVCDGHPLDNLDPDQLDRLSFVDAEGRHTWTTAHPLSSYGVPVHLVNGEPWSAFHGVTLN